MQRGHTQTRGICVGQMGCQEGKREYFEGDGTIILLQLQLFSCTISFAGGNDERGGIHEGELHVNLNRSLRAC